MWWSWGDAGTSRKWLFGNMERACWSIWDPVWRSDDDEKTQTFRLHEENKENAYLRPYVSKWVSCFLPPLHWCGEPFGPRKMGTAKCLRRPGPHQRQAAHEVPGVPSSGAEDEMRTKRLNKNDTTDVTNWMRWTSEFYPVCYGFSDKDSQSFTSESSGGFSGIKWPYTGGFFDIFPSPFLFSVFCL